jgi:hypothetical protein
MTKKKTAKMAIPKEGIFINKNSKGYYVTIKENAFKLAVLGGYNTKQSALKGMKALHHKLAQALYSKPDGSGTSYEYTDLTKKK